MFGRATGWLSLAIVIVSAMLVLPSAASAVPCGFTNSHVNTHIPNGGFGGVSKSLYIPRGNTSNRNLEDVDIRLKAVHSHRLDLNITVSHAQDRCCCRATTAARRRTTPTPSSTTRPPARSTVPPRRSQGDFRPERP